jgi:outer membrane receptor protein involved in Fe transport
MLLAPVLLAEVSVSGTVRDPSGAVVPGAAVVLRQGDQILTATTSTTGEFRFERVPAGQHELLISLPAFEPVRRQVRVGSEPVRSITLRLALAAIKQELTVGPQDSEVSVNADRNAATISVERSMLDNLPILDNNYLSALARFLSPGTPGDAGATLIVDGMEARSAGVTASAIQAIRINNNPYTAEYPRWSRRRIEVITKASADAYHGTFNFLFRDHHLNARDALAASRPQEQRRIYEGSLFGPVGKSKTTSFLLSAARQEEDLVAVVFARNLLAPVNQNVPAPQVNTTASLRISREFSKRQAMFWQANFQDRWQNNIGVGGTTLPEAGAQSRFREDEFIFNHRLVMKPNLLSEFRILLGRFWAPTRSNLSAPRVTVTDAFTGGGAQADRVNTEFHTSLTWMITHTRGRHNLKYGFSLPDWSRRGVRDETNQIGALSFASLADYAAGTPFAAVLQRGDPRLIFIEKNIGGFFQDEWQLRPDLSVAAGARYDWQNYFGDTNNLAPRLSIAYAPDKSRRWVIRAGAGTFFDRSGPGPLWDVLRFNGVHLRRYVLSGAQIPADFTAFTGLGLATSVHRLEPGVQLPGVIQFSAGFERQLSRKTLLAVTYTGTRGVQQLRSRDANAPLPPGFAERPDAGWNALRQIESAGRFEGEALELTLRGDIAPRVSGTLQYALSKTMTDTGGVNWYPASSYAPQGEWGRSDSDRRHQVSVLGTANVHRWMNLGFSLSAATGPPFNITTGRDENRDGMALDRPPGGTRNTGHGPEMLVLDLRWYRELRLAPAKRDRSPTLTLSLDAFNILNRVNYQNFVGALSSPFFGRAVATQPARRMQVGFRLQF